MKAVSKAFLVASAVFGQELRKSHLGPLTKPQGRTVYLSDRPYVKQNHVGRNDPCPCNSGKKYKKCHMLIERDTIDE